MVWGRTQYLSFLIWISNWLHTIYLVTLSPVTCSSAFVTDHKCMNPFLNSHKPRSEWKLPERPLLNKKGSWGMVAEPLGFQILQILGLPHPSWVNLEKYFSLSESRRWYLYGMFLQVLTKPIWGKCLTQCRVHSKSSVGARFYYLAPNMMLCLDLRKSTTRWLSFKWAYEAPCDCVYILPIKKQFIF